MKRFNVAILTLVCIIISSSSCAVVMKDDVSLTHNWNGFYAGINAGFDNHTLNMTDNQGVAFLGTIQQVSGVKVTGGIQVGYRQLINLSPVAGLYGIEGSLNFYSGGFSQSYGSPFALYQFSSNNQVNYVGLLELIGGIAADRILLFLAGGLSWTSIEGNTNNQNSIGFFNSFNVNHRVLGTALGAGIEYALTEKISARVKIDVITPNAYSSTDSAGNSFGITNSIVQATVGLNYQFA